jgi:hypothetical protein
MGFTLESICHIGFGVRLVTLNSPDGSPEASEFAKAFNLANQVVAERFLTPVIWKVKRMFQIGGEGKMVKAVQRINRFADLVIRTRRGELARHEKAPGSPRDSNGIPKATGNGIGFQTIRPEATDDSPEEEGKAPSRRPGGFAMSEQHSSSTLARKRRTFVKKSDAGPETSKSSHALHPQSEPQDLLSRFMSMRDSNGALFSDSYLRDVVINFIIAGRDTSAGAIAWMFYELTRNCHVEELILKELMEVLGLGRGEGERLVEQLSFEKVRKLTFLQVTPGGSFCQRVPGDVSSFKSNDLCNHSTDRIASLVGFQDLIALTSLVQSALQVFVLLRLGRPAKI